MAVSRRHLLAGASLTAGGMLLGPIAEKLRAEAVGRPVRPLRFVFVLEGNGLNPEQVQPTDIPRKKNAQSRNDLDTLEDRPITADTLPTALEPVAEFADRLTVIQGLSGRICGGGHSNDFGALGAYPSKAGPAGRTIDLALAEALPAIFPQVGLGISDRPEHTIIYNTSALGPGQKVPTQCRPDLAYNTLFGSVAGGEAGRALSAKQNLLDFMVSDIQRVESQLAGPERQQLEAYLASFESMRDRQSRINEIEHTLRQHAPAPTDKYTSEIETDRLDAHFDIGAAALIAGLTNVLTIASGCGNPYFSVRFTGLGISLAKHGIGHGGSFEGKAWHELAVMIRRFHFEQIAKLARKLQSVPEGDGTMLDNTLIVYLSDAAEGHHSRCWEWPFVMLGNLGGRLQAGGRFLGYPRYGNRGHRTVANLYTTLLHAAGRPVDHFGLPDPSLRDLDQSGPLEELFA